MKDKKVHVEGSEKGNKESIGGRGGSIDRLDFHFLFCLLLENDGYGGQEK